MEDLSSRLSQLGRSVAEVSDRTADPSTLPDARRRWLSAPPPGSASIFARALASLRGRLAPRPREASPLLARRTGQRARALVVSFATLALTAALAFFLWPRRPAISFAVGASPERGEVGQWVAPEGDSPVDLRFSEGTLVTLAAGARLRVTDTSHEGAALLIERGAIHAAITHRGPDTRWSVRAGPFEVRVTGTSFDARWDPSTETFELSMIDGSVIVSGPHLPSGRPVVAGEHLVVSKSRMELRAGAEPHSAATSLPGAPGAPAACASPGAPPPDPSAAPSSAASDPPLDPAHDPARAPSAAPATSASPAPEASWRALAKAGKYREAMDAAEAAGFSSELGRASSSELLALADAARFAGRPARAKEALLAARRRGARGSSAFLLGKIAADQLRSPGEASVWFETYLQEESGGALAEQALGRLLEIRKRDPKAGRAVAERYLARYPNGAYAALARSLAVPR